MTTKIPRTVTQTRQPHACLPGMFLKEGLPLERILTLTSDFIVHSPGLPSEALEEFLSILRPSSFLYPSPTSPILRRRNNGAVIHFDRQQSNRRSENDWSPQPPSPHAANSVKSLTPDDIVSTERLDPDQDVSSITWYPFDWRAGGPNPAYSPLRKSPIHLLPDSISSRPIVPFCVHPCRPSVDQYYIYGPFRATGSLNCLNPTSLFAHLCSEPDLDSPVNRAQAHNPFGKRLSQQLITSENIQEVGAYIGSSPSPPTMFTRITSPLELPALPPSVSPSTSSASLSPAAVPLPSPSPDEAAELIPVN